MNPGHPLGGPTLQIRIGLQQHWTAMILWLILTACTTHESGMSESASPEDTQRPEDTEGPQDTQSPEDSGVTGCPAGSEQTVVYRETETRTLFGTLSVPPGEGPFPVVVLLPGGAFSGADIHTLAITDPTERLLCDDIAVFAITYHVASDAPNPPLYPEPVTDATCAVHWIRTHAQDYSLRPDRVFLAGESAGGHIATMAALGAGIWEDCAGAAGEPTPVTGVLDFYGPTNWTTLVQDRVDVSSPIQGLIEPEKVYTGSDCTNPDDPLCLQAGVSAWITPDDPPFFIAHSDADVKIPLAQSLYLNDRIREAGIPSQMVRVRGLEHGWAGSVSKPKVGEVYDKAVAWILDLSQ
jgi:acetyl esterase/lipase